MRKTIIAAAVSAALALPAAASADLTPTSGPGCMSHAGLRDLGPQHGNNDGHVAWGDRFVFSNEHGNNIPESYDPSMSSSDFKEACR